MFRGRPRKIAQVIQPKEEEKVEEAPKAEATTETAEAKAAQKVTTKAEEKKK